MKHNSALQTIKRHAACTHFRGRGFQPLRAAGGRAKFLRHLASVPLLLTLLVTCTLADERPNVLFIALDDLNDWLGCYGGHPDARTPHIDGLAQRGMLFTNAHCVSPICGPSRASVLTGRRPETTGVYHNRGTYADYVPDAVTFPEHFRVHGYRALAAGKINHGLGEPDPKLWDQNGPDCGLLGTPFIGNELDTLKPGESLTVRRGGWQVTLPANGGLSWIDRPQNQWNSFDWAPLDVSENGFPDGKIAHWGVEQLTQEHGKPLLLAIGFYKPHQPFFAPRKYFELYDRKTVRLPKTIRDDLADVPLPGRYLATRPWTSGSHETVTKHEAWRDAVHAYLATVSFVDALVGQVVVGLDSGPHADNTWIVLWSDHGWSLGEKEHWGKHVPWTECVRVPLIVVPPRGHRPQGFQAGSRCEAHVSLLDLYPTLTELCGLPLREDLEGRSLLPLIGDPNSKWNEAAVSTIGRGTHSVATDSWRYIRYFDGSEELYDLRQDPEEWTNIAGRPENEEVQRRLAAHIPQDKRLKRFVRWGGWKCVFPVDGQPMLFDYEGDFGISEQNDVAEQNPDVVRAMQAYVTQTGTNDRRVTMPGCGPGLRNATMHSARGSENNRPNILCIMVDDMGYSDIGCYGGEIDTPHLDALAARGLRFTQFYNAGRCCPTRASLLTGLYAHQTGLGFMTARDYGKPGYRAELNRNCVTLAEVLKLGGYRTYMAGKWHLCKDFDPAGPKHNWPRQRGFDRFYGTLIAAGSQWNPMTLTEDNTPVKPPGDFFYTEAISRKAVEYIQSHDADHPFFLYVAHTAPHWPLHARANVIEKYRGRFADGWDVLRRRRLNRLAEAGILSRDLVLSERGEGIPPWKDAPHKQWEQSRMEAFAAMVDHVDQGVGDIVQALRQKGLLENTLIFFLSDNGGDSLEHPDGRIGSTDKPWAYMRYVPLYTRDGRPVIAGDYPGLNLGPDQTYGGYGTKWANLSNAPFRYYKKYAHEGGVATPLIVHWPAGIKGRGELRHQPAHVIDLMATSLEVAGAAYPDHYRNESIKPLDGKSLLPVFERDTAIHEALFFEHHGNRAVRKGKWKIVGIEEGPWALYDMERDRTETTDLAVRHPDVVRRLAIAYEQWARRSNVLPVDALKIEEIPGAENPLTRDPVEMNRFLKTVNRVLRKRNLPLFDMAE